MAEDISTPVATCPKCGRSIPYGHPYPWCAECGNELPAEIQAQLPRLQENAARAAAARVALTTAEPYVADEAEAIAKLYRRLVLLVGGQILASFLGNFLAQALGSIVGLVVSLLGLPAALVISVFLAITAYKLAERLQAGTPILWAIAMFIPCVNIIVLLALSSNATSWCRRHGIKVGFFGPTQESIEEIRRGSVTSAFD